MGRCPPVYGKVTRIIDAQRHIVAPWPLGHPEGITIHDTAGPTMVGALATLNARNLRYHLIIDRDGLVYQTTYFTGGVYHAGDALWNGKSPNRCHVAIALVSWGPLDATGCTWTGSQLDATRIVHRPSNVDGKIGQWDGAQPAQLNALTEACLWFMAFGLPVTEICGHDEAALPHGRKQDPGGVLPWTMPEYRAHLATLPAPPSIDAI